MGALTGKSVMRPQFGRFLSMMGFSKSGDAKRCAAWEDYGYPEQLTFINFYNMFTRNGLGKAGVMRHVEKCWQTAPWIVEGSEGENPHDETQWEKAVAELVRKVQLWQRFQAADWRNRVGRYSALYLVFGDGQAPDQPVTRAGSLVKVQPLYESQLTVKDSVEDPLSPDYGMPAMYTFNEAAVGDNNPDTNKKIDIHPDRIHILAEGADDGSIYGIPALEACYNDLLTLEKIIGAGGEGFWKAARGAWALEGEVDPSTLAAMYGVDPSEVGDKLNETAADFASGMDKMLMLGGLKANSLSFSVPSPDQFYNNALQSVVASLSCPLPILIGQQIAQRSSDENSKEWIQTCTSRRRNFLTPNIEELIRKLMRFGLIAEKPFWIDWDELDAPGQEQKLANAKSMSEINKNSMGTGETPAFTAAEIREAAGYEREGDWENEFADSTPTDNPEERDDANPDDETTAGSRESAKTGPQ